MYSVALVGHSNLPVFPGWENVQLETFRVPGALLTDLRDENRFDRSLFTNSWDCVVTFLGGNDIAECRDQDELYQRHMDAFRALDTDQLVVTDLEPRTYNQANEERFDLTTNEYNTIAKIVNKKLKRYAKRTANVELVHVKPGYLEDSVDGIHLTNEGKRHLIRKYKRLINEFR